MKEQFNPKHCPEDAKLCGFLVIVINIIVLISFWNKFYSLPFFLGFSYFFIICARMFVGLWLIFGY